MPLKISAEEPPTLNLTSMIDVLFLLIIFFMAGTQFTELERNIALQVPQVSQGQNLAVATSRRTIGVHRDGQITLDRELVTIEELSKRLADQRRANPRLSVTVRGDGEGTFQNVASVLAACRGAGVTDLGITVRIGQGTEAEKRR